jgi:hypothetical protein
MLWIALEWLDEGIDDIISDAIPLLKNDNEYHFLYVNPSSYLKSPNTPSVSDVSCSFGAVDTYSIGMQISWLSILTNL